MWCFYSVFILLSNCWFLGNKINLTRPLKMLNTLDFFINNSFPSKHSSWWRRTENVLKTSSRRLQCNVFLSSKTSWRHNCKTSCKHVLKTSWRHFRKTYCKYVLKTSSRRLQEVLEHEKCYAEDVKKCLLGYKQLYSIL